MALFRRQPAPELTDQDPLADHLVAVARKRDGALGDLIRAMLAQDLWQAWRELPPGMEPGQRYVLTEPLNIAIAGTTMPDGGRALAVFSSAAAVSARHPEAVPVRSPGSQVLARLLTTDEFAGAVLDPAGPTFQILLRAWVRDAAAGRL